MSSSDHRILAGSIQEQALESSSLSLKSELLAGSPERQVCLPELALGPGLGAGGGALRGSQSRGMGALCLQGEAVPGQQVLCPYPLGVCLGNPQMEN